MKKCNKKGFTLIEMLAVVIIIGVLLIIAVPSVTSYISESRKTAYVDTVKSLVKETKAMINDGDLKMFDLTATYYIPSSCISLEGGKAESPYGKFEEAYVVVSYTGEGYNYYWVSVDETGQGIKTLTKIEDLSEKDVKSDLTLGDLTLNSPVEGKDRIIKYSKNCTIEETEESEIEQINANTWRYKDLEFSLKIDDIPCNSNGGYNICYNSKAGIINIGSSKTIKSFKVSFDVPEGTILIHSGFDASKIQLTLDGTRLTITGNKNLETWNYLTPGYGYESGFQIKYPDNVEFSLTNPTFEYVELVSDTQTGTSTGVQGNAEDMYIELPTIKIELKRLSYWNSGSAQYTAQYDVYVTNISTQAITDWSFVLDTPVQILNIVAWNPLMVSQSGSAYTLSPSEYDNDRRTLDPGEVAYYSSQMQITTTDTNVIPDIR